MNEFFKKILEIAGKNEVYIVGGWLRDKILHKENRDLDIITLSNPIDIAKKITRGLNGRLVILDSENKIYRVVLKNDKRLDYIDISKMKGSNILADLKNRDFTINSFAVLLGKEIKISEIIDPCKGLIDLKAKKIRLTSAHALADDPLRMLRAYRMASELKFKIVPETINQIKKHASKIEGSAWERIREEFFKILSSEDALNKIEDLEKTGVLGHLFPEIEAMKRSGRKFYYHPKGLWQHSTETLRSLENIIKNLDKLFNKSGEKIKNHLNEPLSSGITRLNLLKIVSLFHDIAKPSTAKRVGDRMRFLGHESKGAQKVSEVLKRLRLGASDIKIAKTLVEYHMRPISLSQASILTHRAVFRFFRDLGENTIDLLLLALADWHSYKGLKYHEPGILKEQEVVLKELVKRYFLEKEKPALPKIIDGNILMKKFKLKPGPIIGKLLNKIKEAQHLGKVGSQEEALNLAKKILRK